jgi:hypothetical protein
MKHQKELSGLAGQLINKTPSLPYRQNRKSAAGQVNLFGSPGHQTNARLPILTNLPDEAILQRRRAVENRVASNSNPAAPSADVGGCLNRFEDELLSPSAVIEFRMNVLRVSAASERTKASRSAGSKRGA